MSSSENNFFKIAYFASLAGVSILLGFSASLSKLKKGGSPSISLHEEGVELARKALFRGTLYSVCGFGIFVFGSYHLFGKKLIERKTEEFRKAREKPINWPEQ